MSPEQQDMIYKYFPELVQTCDLEQIMRKLSITDTAATKVLDNITIEDDRRHNNRCILFELMLVDCTTIFPTFVEALRNHDCNEIADKLENKPSVPRRKHITCCTKLPDDMLNSPSNLIPLEALKIDVKYATKFCDIEDYCYRTRSKNRGQVLIINNVLFNTPNRHTTRLGAEVDESNLHNLFVNIGFAVDMYRNLTAEEIQNVTKKFCHKDYQCKPDVGIVIIMSHGEKIDNKTVIIGSDGRGVEEQWIVRQFNNQTCALFRNKPKILVFNICRGNLVDDLAQFAQHTQSDAACTKKADLIAEDQRYYSDLMICHPSVEGFQAHRDTVRGCWYIELLCKNFMENSHDTDVETMLKMVERGLKTRISEKMTRQTSTFLNIAFKTCFLNPGIYEESGEIVKIEQPL